MEEDSGVATATDTKEVQQASSRRSSGIANMFPFRQRQSMDTDDHSRSIDRPRKAGMGGKVKPGFGGKHRPTGSGDLSSGEPASPLASGAAADSPSAAWAAVSNSYSQAEVTDTLSLSQLSPAPVATTPSARGNAFFKFSFKKKQGGKGCSSPGVPSSPTLPGATPTHASSMSFSASGSSVSGAGGSQSPSDSLCRAGAGSSNGGGQHAGGSKLGQLNSCSGDPDDAEYGSCYSDALHSPNMSYQEAMYAGDTLDLRQAGFGMPGDASPMAAMRQELPEVFTPGFNHLLDRDCTVGREPDTPQDHALEPTVALLSTAQLSQVAQMYDAQSMLLNRTAADGPDGSAAGAAAPAAQPAAATPSGSKGSTLLEVEDVSAPAAPEALTAQEPALPASPAAASAPQAPEQEAVPVAAEAPTAAEDINVTVCADGASAAAVAQEEEQDAAATAAAANSVHASGAPAADEAAEEPHAATPAPAEAAHATAADKAAPAFADPAAGAAEAAEQVAGPAAAAVECPPEAVGQDSAEAAAAAPASATEEAGEVQHAAPEQAPAAAAAAEPAPVEGPTPAAVLPAAVAADGRADAVEGAVQHTSSQHSKSTVASPEHEAELAPAAEVAASGSDSAADAACGSPQQQSAGGSASLQATEAQHAEVAADPPPAADMAGSAAELAACSPVAPVSEPPCADGAVFEQPPRDNAVTAAETAPAAPAATADSNEAQAVQDLQEGAPVSCCQPPSEPVHQPQAAVEQLPPAEEVSPAAADAQLGNSSNGTGQDVVASQVASHVIADMRSELSLAEASSTVVGQPSEAAAPPAAEQPVVPAALAGAADEAASGLLPLEEESGLLPEVVDGEPALMPEASEEPVLPAGDSEDDLQQPSSPPAATDSAAAPFSSPSMASRPRSSGRRSGRTPVSMVRESIPLFLSDPSRAVGASLVVEDSLDDQDMQQLTGGALLAAGAAGAAAGRLLAHGGPQRVALGFAGGSSQLPPLASVAEGFATSPIPEETSTGGSSQSRTSSRYEAAAAGSPGSSPVRQLAMSAPGSSPCLGMTPGSVYSTPTLTMGQAAVAGGRTQLGATPASAMSSAVGSAIRDVGSAGGFGKGDRGGVSPALPGNMNVSPTLQLMPNLGSAAGMGQETSGDGSTPSLLDARAASPSAVYNTLCTTTPFRGALAALPIDAALAAPLVDSSPFDITDDGTFEKLGMAEEAQRVAQNLAAAAAGFGTTPFPARTPGAALQRPLSPGGTALRAQLVERMASPELTDGLRDMHEKMAIKQITALEKRVKELEGENMRLKEQVDIYEFEKTELNSQEEMEKQARLYAEEQLQEAKMALQCERQAKAELQGQVKAKMQEFAELLQEATQKHEQEKERALALQQQLEQMQGERNQALDRVDMLDTELTAVRANGMSLQGALQKEQQRSADMEVVVAAKDKDLGDMTRINNELRGKLEKAMEQLIAAQTAKEHAREKAHEESAKAVQYYNECQQLLGERQTLLAAAEKHRSDWTALKTRYAHKSSTLKEVEQRLQAKELEVQELMGMCDQLLQQREAQTAVTAP